MTSRKKRPDSFQILADKYATNQLIPFTSNIMSRADPIPLYQHITHANYVKHIDQTHDSIAIRLGTLIGDNRIGDNRICAIMVSSQSTDQIANGMVRWKELSRNKKIRTPTQRTETNDLQYIFSLPSDIFDSLAPCIAHLTIDSQLYSIEYRGRDQYMVVAPSAYGEKYYKWKTTDYTQPIQPMPLWLQHILAQQPVPPVNAMIQITEYERSLRYTDDNIQYLVSLLAGSRASDYDNWLDLGMILHGIDRMYLLVWKKWSQGSDKYTPAMCGNKWKTFSKIKTKPTIDTLLLWCATDNLDRYNAFIKEVTTNHIINDKFPQVNLQIGDTQIITKNHSYANLNNENCLIYGTSHGKPTMYVEMIKDMMTIKCKHPECFGKIYPCEHVQLTKNEMNVIFNGNVNVNVSINGMIDDIEEFKKINLFETAELNELIYNGLNGKSIPYAHIIYEYNQNKYMCAENEDWYLYESHRWIMLKGYNTDLRKIVNTQLKKIYTTVKDYYAEQDGKGSKMDSLSIMI